MLTLQFALKRAMERFSKSNLPSLASPRLATRRIRNILYYEAAEGTLGILSQLVEQTGPWRRVIEEAMKVCQLRMIQAQARRLYDNLLDYYNQRHHPRLDRWLIKGAFRKPRRLLV